ncbi:hypothetical protein FIV42_20435 [Persicimonas caeni]|uniref:Uncharacterized protein n=1 Tax=Persicimonas caeni TaxID=2292766 RepID=A0A4Y6PZ58_PERCE|nr:hypothetical protein [Persicimonas caeni]QDG53025.1 hypothetical protein FIV42_20435 [Persicimonas caeni]QED34247.1 hypothetical protein FRD00_20430 [Persicimonas caeni]
MTEEIPQGFESMLQFGLVEALVGRRSRRFFMGAELPDGVFAYKSKHDPEPLSEFEKLLVVGACAGNTGWNNLIYRAERYAPHLSNYAGAAGGRTFPSAAGFHTSMTFFTDDDGVYVLDNRDAPASAEPDADGHLDLDAVLDALRGQVTKLQDGRLGLPAEVPFVEAHNTWVANQEGTLLVIPVGDLAQHTLLGLCYMLQNGQVVYDDVHDRPVPGIEAYSHLYEEGAVWPVTFLDQLSLGEMSVEVGTSCYAGALMLQAMGLGGWMYNGMDPFSVLGASGEADVPGLGFRFDEDERWTTPNVTGLDGVMEGHCPPHFEDMHAATRSVYERKFGAGGPFNPETPGPWKDSHEVRGAAQVHSEEFIDCVALQAQYIYDTFGKFPATVPSIFTLMYLQAQHLDRDFYDEFYGPGAYLETHRHHMERWHRGE